MANATHGSFVWYDVLSPDPDAAVAFYRDVVGWTARPFAGTSGYTMFSNAQGPLAGAIKPEGPGAPAQWIGNVYVDDVDSAAALVRELGGQVLQPPTDYPPIGRLAVILDPQGAPMNLFRPTQPIPLRDTTRPGEVTWCELMSSDHAAAFAFYGRLFGWRKLRGFDMGPRGEYLIFGDGTREVGGMFTSAGTPSRWLYYIQVADLDAAVVRAQGQGAKVTNGPMEVPGGARVAQLRDPQGIAFALHENAKPGA